MRTVFADTYFWIALLNDQDQGHTAAQAMGLSLRGVPFVTTQEILAEVLDDFDDRGRDVRQAAASFVDGILSDPTIRVRPQSQTRRGSRLTTIVGN